MILLIEEKIAYAQTVEMTRTDGEIPKYTMSFLMMTPGGENMSQIA